MVVPTSTSVGGSPAPADRELVPGLKARGHGRDDECACSWGHPASQLAPLVQRSEIGDRGGGSHGPYSSRMASLMMSGAAGSRGMLIRKGGSPSTSRSRPWDERGHPTKDAWLADIVGPGGTSKLSPRGKRFGRKAHKAITSP